MRNLFLSLGVAIILSACGGMIKNENGSEHLVKLDSEPIGCVFLYKLESEVSVYDADDARRYLENRIADQARGGNAYWITSQRTRPNEWVIFGPERAFVLAANVYNCSNPQNVRTARGKNSDYVKEQGVSTVTPIGGYNSSQYVQVDSQQYFAPDVEPLVIESNIKIDESLYGEEVTEIKVF